MHTIALATQKGGSGKSTLAIGLALAAKQAGFTVRLIETDPQGTLSNWQRRRTTGDLVEPIYHAADIEPRLKMLADSGLQLAIVDTAAGLSAATTAAIRHCDLCLIPARPSVADIEATVSTLSVARAWKRPYSFVLNQTPIRGQRIDNAANTLAEEAAPRSRRGARASADRDAQRPPGTCPRAALPSANSRRTANRQTRSAASGIGSRPGSSSPPPPMS